MGSVLSDWFESLAALLQQSKKVGRVDDVCAFMDLKIEQISV